MNGEIHLDTKLLAYLIWGVGTVYLYGRVFVREAVSYRRYPDRRNRRDLIGAFALFLTALAAFLATTMVLFGQHGSDIRGLLISMALGAFFAAGLVMAFDKDVR